MATDPTVPGDADERTPHDAAHVHDDAAHPAANAPVPQPADDTTRHQDDDATRTAASGVVASVSASDAPNGEAITEPHPTATGRRPVGVRIERPFVLGFLLTLGGLTAWLLGTTLTDISTILVYIAFALFIALGLDPVVRWIMHRGLSRAWAVVITIVLFLVVFVGVFWLVIPTAVDQITLFVQSVPSLVTEFMRSDFFHWLEGFFGTGLQTLVTDAQSFIADPANIAAIGGGALQVSATVFNGISGTIIVLVLTLYFIASLPGIKTSLYRLAPARSRASISELSDQITDSIGGYLGGMVVLAAMNAIVSGVLYAVLGLPFPLLMAVIAFCITLIPLVGTVLFWSIGSVLAVFSDPLSALVFAAVYLVYMQIEAYLLTPRVMSRTISVPGALVVIGALVGGTLLGLLGALVAIPVTASFLLIIKKVWIPRQDAKR